MEKKFPPMSEHTYKEKASTISLNTNQENQSHMDSEQVENGVRLVKLTHADEVWRLGAVTPTWRNALTSLGANPSTENINSLQQQGIWLAKDKPRPRVAIVCSGQGAVWPHMGRELYDRIPAARAAMDRLAAVAKWDILSLMDEPDMAKLLQTRWQMPYVLLVGYAQAHYLESLGFKADMYAGHSLGELLALCLSGAYTPETAWEIFDLRAHIMGEMEQNNTQDSGMLAVYAPFEKIESTLKAYPELCISNYNSPTQYILSGPKDVIVEARRILRREQKIPSMVLNVTMAFHHPHLRVVRKRSLDSLLAMDVKSEHEPIFSNYTAKLYPQDRVGICEHIVDLDENAVRWVECVQSMKNDFEIQHFVEVGPTDTLSNFIAEIEPRSNCVTLSYKNKELVSIRNAVAKLFALGFIQGRSSYVVPDDMVFVDEQKQVMMQEDAGQDIASMPSYVQDIIPILSKVTGFKPHELGAHMDLRLDLAMRSSRFPVVINEIEKTFAVQVNFEDLISVTTVGDLAQAVAKIRQVDFSHQHNVDTHDNKQKYPIIRSVLEQRPVHLDINDIPLTAEELTNLLPALVVGTGLCAKIWFELLQSMLDLEHVVMVDNIEQAQIKFEQGFTPALLVLESDVTYGSILNYVNLCQTFFNNDKAYMCLLHEQSQAGFLGSEIFAAMHGLFLSAALEFPSIKFRTLTSEQGIGNTALQGFMRKLLCPNDEFPLGLHLGQSHISSLALKPSPWPAMKQGLPIARGQVIVVSGAERRIVFKALQGIAPLGCTLVLLGRATLPDTDNIEALTKLGATCAYYSCDISNINNIEGTLKLIHEEYGNVDGLIHGTCITQDILLNELSIAQLEQSLHDKHGTLYNLLAGTMPYGLRYTVVVSSLLAWGGSIGHADYIMANRSMAVLLEDFCRTHNIAWRCLWCAPIVEEVKALADHDANDIMSSWHMGLIDEEELPMLFVRELLCGAEEHAFWHRSIPKMASVLDSPTPSAAAKVNIVGGKNQLYPLQLSAGAWPAFIAQRNFSTYAEDALEVKNHVIQDSTAQIPTMACVNQGYEWPMVHSLLMLDAMYETANMGFAWWKVCGADNLVFESPFACPQGVTRECEITIQSKELQVKDKNTRLSCSAELQLYDISANGRRMPSKQKTAWAQMYLGDDSYKVSPLWTESAQVGINTHDIHEYNLLRKNIAQWGYSGYNYVVECIVALQRLIVPTCENYYISSIARLRHVPICSSYDNIDVYWRLQDVELDKIIDAQVFDVKGNILLTVHGLHMRPNQ